MFIVVVVLADLPLLFFPCWLADTVTRSHQISINLHHFANMHRLHPQNMTGAHMQQSCLSIFDAAFLRFPKHTETDMIDNVQHAFRDDVDAKMIISEAKFLRPYFWWNIFRA